MQDPVSFQGAQFSKQPAQYPCDMSDVSLLSPSRHCHRTLAKAQEADQVAGLPAWHFILYLDWLYSVKESRWGGVIS